MAWHGQLTDRQSEGLNHFGVERPIFHRQERKRTKEKERANIGSFLRVTVPKVELSMNLVSFPIGLSFICSEGRLSNESVSSYFCCIVVVAVRFGAEGPYIYDVRKIFGIFGPLPPPCPHLDQI